MMGDQERELSQSDPDGCPAADLPVSRLPRTMATQHPDSATRYIAIQEEAKEAVQALSPPPLGFGIEEIMVDFEGKMTPYHQTNEIAQGLLDRGVVPGRDAWITPRISSATEETAFRQLMALMSVIEATYQASQREPEARIEEVIIPMVQRAADLVKVRDRVRDVIYLGHKEFRLPYDPDALQLVPLMEEVPDLLSCGELLREYVHTAGRDGFGVRRLRVMLGRSDAALSYGHLPSALSAKVALAQVYSAGIDLELEPAPILGAGYLPFRGGVSLANTDRLLADYPGLRTVTIQGGLRYDTEEAGETVRALHEGLAGPPPSSPCLDHEEEAFLRDAIGALTVPYLRTFDRLLDVVLPLSDLLPAQRDRLARKGAAGYARAAAEPELLVPMVHHEEVKRDLKSVALTPSSSLPRAISFTGAMYSLGVPPEFLGTGRGLARVRELFGEEGLARLRSLYRSLPHDLSSAARFLNLDTARTLLPHEALVEIEEDVRLCRELVGYAEPGPDDRYHLLLETIQPMLRSHLTKQELVGPNLDLVREWLSRLGALRGSLG
jgi:phosphoenolpyruvate carboxylase